MSAATDWAMTREYRKKTVNMSGYNTRSKKGGTAYIQCIDCGRYNIPMTAECKIICPECEAKRNQMPLGNLGIVGAKITEGRG